MNRRHAHTLATPALTGGDDRPQGACVGRPEPFDDLIDYSSGPRYFFALAEARSLCRSCPIWWTCFQANRDESWLQKVAGTFRDPHKNERGAA